VGAGPESVTEQFAEAPDATDVGEHCNDVTAGAVAGGGD